MLKKLIVFGVTHWNSKKDVNEQKNHLIEWYTRVKKYVPYSEIFLTAGTYSDPAFNPLRIPIINNGIKYTQEYCIEWNYFRNGFMTGIWHAALNLDFDVLCHIQCRNLIGEDLTQYFEDFYKRDESIMAPQWNSSKRGTCIEVSLMAMKKPAIEKYLAGGLRPSLSPYGPLLNTEEEAFHLFDKGEWYNPFYWIKSIRKRDPDKWNAGRKYSQWDVKMEDFIKLPFVASSIHCSKEELEEWKKEHPI